MNRRGFIRIAGTAGIITAAGIGGFALTRNPRAALEAWRTAGNRYTDPMRRALSYAILAPNPHNRQPWLIDLKSDHEASLSCDLERMLAATDPFDRQIVIGLGCFLELFAIAASASGYRADITLFPQGEPESRVDTRPIAHLRLIEDASTGHDLLFDHVLNRRTNREPYDTSRPVPGQALNAIIEAAGQGVTTGGAVDGERLAPLRELTRVALRDEILDPQAFQETIDLMRIGRAEIEANPDGIYLGGAFLEAMNIAGVLTREQLADPDSRSFQIGLDMADEQAMTAMGFVWLNTPGNSRADQVAAGRGYLRVALQTTALGLAMQPMSQALQEYKTMEPHYRTVHQMLTGGGNERVQMLARLGYAQRVAPAARWALATRIRNS